MHRKYTLCYKHTQKQFSLCCPFCKWELFIQLVKMHFHKAAGLHLCGFSKGALGLSWKTNW